MGGRGAFSPTLGRTGGILPQKRIYSCIDRLGNIKIIQCDRKKNNPAPTRSNTCNTTYFSYSKENGRIEHIYYYKNHLLVRSVDFCKGEKPHMHYWGKSLTGRKRHDPRNIFPLTPKDERLKKMADKYNENNNG